MVLEEILTYTLTTVVLLFKKDLIHFVAQVSNLNVHFVNISLLKVDPPVRHHHSDTVLHSGYYNLKTKVGNGHCFNSW